MPLDVPLQESHRGYIRAVAAALAQAGISVTDVDFLDDVWDDGDPIRCAQFPLARLATMQVYGVLQVYLSWSEEWGWAFHANAPGSIMAGLTHPLCDQVLPAPAEVLAAVQDVLAELPEPTGRPHPSYRSYGHHDEALEDQLDTYTAREDEGMGRPGDATIRTRHGDRCPACGRRRVLSEDGSNGDMYLYCPARGCRWTQDVE